MERARPPYIDNIFGTMVEPAARVERHSAARSGVRHLNRVSPADPQPGQPLTVYLTTGGPAPYDAARCWWRAEAPGAEPSTGVVELAPASVSWDNVSWSYVREWAGELPPQPAGTMLRYTLAAHVSGSERWVFADEGTASADEATAFAVYVADDPPPAWAYDAVVYHIFVDRFNPGAGRPWQRPARLDGFFGGTLRGVIEQLDYIQGLGFSAIWLSPIFASPSHHGYNASDYYTVEPRLGSNADLLELFAEAHGRGMRVILDFVANHWSDLHPTFQAARADEHSEYHDWYTWASWPEEYGTYFGVRELPELNLNHPPARAHMLEAAAHWLRAGADGLRLDYAHGPGHDFWADFRRACREARADCWLFGEINNHADLLRTYAGRMDGVLDFLLAQAIRETFTRGTWDLEQLEAFLAGHEAYFPPTLMRPSFLDNHDMNRFLFMAHGDTDTLRLAALLLFTLEGPPIIYYGTEAGVTQNQPIHDENSFGVFEEARLPMKWGAEQDAGLRELFRVLIGLRRANPVLITGARRVLHLDSAAGTYAYLREGERPVLAALNLGPQPTTLTLARAGLPADAADRLGGLPVRVTGDTVTVELPAHGGAFVA